MTRIRLDEWLVSKGHYSSRARARDAILRGCIALEGDISPKPSRTVPGDNAVQINDPAKRYVSRAAVKLVHALEQTGFDPGDRVALDLGASTGGFCQVLLERGATHVFGVDVGHDQMAEPLRMHRGLTNLEGLNARDLKIEHLRGKSPEFITSDISFISLKLALPPALELAAPNTFGVFLVKPQFEVGKDGLGKGGIVRDASQAKSAAESVSDWLDGFPDWRVTDFFPSPITGGDGNREFLLAGVKDG
ncbi:MAG: TlyA family RNA methyltransferase [Rhizobiaceae bacterium]